MWREVRATEPGLLEGIAGRPEPPEGAIEYAGGFSVVTDTGDGRVKKLPSFYVNTSQMYAHRDVAVVRAKLDRAIEAFTITGRGAYMLTPCEIGGRKGLYGTDFFNRSAYRLKLKRLGMRFSDDPFVTFRDDSAFEASDFAPFEPTFITLPRRSDAPPGVVPTKGAMLVYQLTFYRIADIPPEELSRLVAIARTLDAMSATEPEDLVEALSNGHA